MTHLRLPESKTEYRNALIDAAELGAQKALIEADMLRPYLNLRQAQRKYGAAIVKRWHEEGLIRFIKDGNYTASIRIDRIQIEAIAKACNRATFLTTEERVVNQKG
jgi:hypothetical protein